MRSGWHGKGGEQQAGIERLDAFDSDAKVRTDARQATDDFGRIVGMMVDACKHLGEAERAEMLRVEAGVATTRN